MALIKCRGCGKKVSLQASACPKCGQPPPTPEQLKRENAETMKGLGFLIIIGLVLFIGVSVINGFNSWQEEAANLDYFSSNKAEILSTMQSQMIQENYSQALSLSKRYRSTKDRDLLALEMEAKDKKLQMDNQAEERKILAEVKTVPGKEWEMNKKLYAKLMSLNPNEPSYKQKHDYYSSKITSQEEERNRLISKFGEPPMEAGLMTTYYFEVEQYLKRKANDPDSIEFENCTNVHKSQQGWLVGCVYRGKNGYGGVVKNANWFTIRHSQVVKVDPSSTYSWQ